MKKQYWTISVGGGYGSFLFEGNEVEAEEMRRHKATWEQAIARKRPATKEEISQANVEDERDMEAQP